MFGITGNARFFLYEDFVDMRKWFEGLGAIEGQALSQELTSSAYFVFLNRQLDRMEVLYWDVDGLVLWYKRFEKRMLFEEFFTRNYSGEERLFHAVGRGYSQMYKSSLYIILRVFFTRINMGL